VNVALHPINVLSLLQAMSILFLQADAAKLPIKHGGV